MKAFKLLGTAVALTLICGRLALAVPIEYTCSTFNGFVLTMKCHFGYTGANDYMHYTQFKSGCTEDARTPADSVPMSGWLAVTPGTYQSYWIIYEFCGQGLEIGTWQWHTISYWDGVEPGYTDHEEDSTLASWWQTPQHKCSSQ